MTVTASGSDFDTTTVYIGTFSSALFLINDVSVTYQRTTFVNNGLSFMLTPTSRGSIEPTGQVGFDYAIAYYISDGSLVIQGPGGNSGFSVSHALNGVIVILS